jgi:antitoxin component of MazEF toxin-antitoxin module
MARRKLGDQNIRKLTRTGNNKSMSVTLPIEFIRDLQWRDGQKVVVNKRGKKLTVEDWQED